MANSKASKVTTELNKGHDQGEEVEITKSAEQWSEFTLKDGTVIKGKITILSASRINGQYDQEGNPIYALKIAPLITYKSPLKLRKKETR